MEKVHIIYQTIFQLILETSLRDLQYKIVMGVLPTNTLLVKYFTKFTNLCALCNNNEDTIYTFFCDCTKTHTIWCNLTDFFSLKR